MLIVFTHAHVARGARSASSEVSGWEVDGRNLKRGEKRTGEFAPSERSTDRPTAGRQRWLDARHLEGKERKSVFIRMNDSREESLSTQAKFATLIFLFTSSRRSFAPCPHSRRVPVPPPNNTPPPSHLHTLAKFCFSLCFWPLHHFSEPPIPILSSHPLTFPLVSERLVLRVCRRHRGPPRPSSEQLLFSMHF